MSALPLAPNPHNHPADNAAPQKREVLSSLKRKAAEQPLSVSQNLSSKVLADSTSEDNQRVHFNTSVLIILDLCFKYREDSLGMFRDCQQLVGDCLDYLVARWMAS